MAEPAQVTTQAAQLQNAMQTTLDRFQGLRAHVGHAYSTFGSGGLMKEAMMTKSAATDTTTSDTSNTTYSDPSWYHPALTPPNWLLPRSLLEVHNWSCPVIPDRHNFPGAFVFSNPGVKRIDEFHDGDKVLSQTGGYQEISHTTVHDFDGDIYFIKPNNLTGFVCTWNHPLLVIRDGKPFWIFANNVNKDTDYLLFPKYKVCKKAEKIDLSQYTTESKYIKIQSDKITGHQNNTTRFIDIDKRLSRILAWHIADGCCRLGKRNNGNGYIGFAKDENDHVLQLSRDFKEVFGLDVSVKEKKNIYLMYWYSTPLANFLIQECGVCEDKKIPRFIIDSDNDTAKEFINNYGVADGWKSKSGSVQIVVYSHVVASQLMLMCSKLGFLPSTRYTTARDLMSRGSYKTQKGRYDIFIRSKNAGFDKTIKQDPNYFYIPIRSIEKEHYAGKVYDIQTPDQTFCAPVLVHNCNIFYNNDPYIQAIINLHAEYPLSKFDLICPDNYVKQFFDNMLSTKIFDLYSFICEAALQWWKLGEFVAIGDWNPKELVWNTWTTIDSDSIIIRRPPVFGGPFSYKLKVTDAMMRMATSNDEEEKGQFDNLPDYIKEAIEARRPIDLPSECCGMMARITRPGDVRGTPLMQSLFKECISGDTKIALLDGTNSTVEQLYKENKTDFEVYSIDDNGRIVEGRAKGVVLKGIKKIVKVTLDDGSSFKCTADHKIKMRNGQYKEAGALRADDSLMPLYRRIKQWKKHGRKTTPYEMIYNPVADKEEYTHLVVFGEDRNRKTEVIHHANFCSTDNRKKNLIKMSRKNHRQYHKELLKSFHEQRLEGIKKYWQTEGTKQAQSDRAVSWWDSDRGAAEKEKRRIDFQQRWIRDRDGMLGATRWQDNPLIREKHSIATKEGIEKSGYKERRSFLSKQLWQQEWYRNIMTARNHSVVSVVPAGEENVYDIINVSPHQNFGIVTEGRSGIFVHNCMYMDRLRVAQQAIADRHITPLQLWKIGNIAANIIPSEEQLEDFRAALEKAALDPSFSLIYHDGVQYEAVGIVGKILPLIPEFEWVQDRIMVGMGVNKSILTGEGPAFSSPQFIALQVLINRYMNFRDKIEKWIENNVFRRVSEENKFYDTSVNPPKLIIPTVSWYKELVIEAPQEKDMFVRMHKDGIISTRTLFSKFKDLDYDTEKKRLEEEVGSIFDKDRLARPKKAVISGGPAGGMSDITNAPEIAGGPAGAPKPAGPGTPAGAGATPAMGAGPTTPAAGAVPAAPAGAAGPATE